MSVPENKAVFLSYASQDADAARRIAETLRSAGVEVWFDESELVGGDAWDTKIRREIASCALFVPIISTNTQARLEGYFRLEWKLAAQRTHTMAEEKSFLLPVVIDATRDADAKVPVEFRAVQWTKLPAGETSSAFVNRVQKLLGGPSIQTVAIPPSRPLPNALHPGAKSRRVFWVATALVTLALGIITFVALRPTANETPAAATADTKAALAVGPVAPARSVAVLAFTNLSADKDTEYFSDGISEELRNVLANIPDLKVAARTSAVFYKGKQVSIKQIAQELGVAYVVDGTVQKFGARLRIKANLIKADDGFQLWSAKFEHEMKDIFAVQDEIAGLVATNLSIKLGTTSLGALDTAPGQTKNLAAYEAYQRGRAMQISGLRRSRNFEAVQLYEEAVRLDPAYALAWARLAQSLLRGERSGGYEKDQNARVHATARNAAIKALDLAPQLPEAHIAMAEVRLSIDHDLEEAHREIAEAERLRPNDSEVPAIWVRLDRASGRWGEKLVSVIARAAELDPHNATTLNTLGSVLTEIGRFPDAQRLLERSWMLSQESAVPLRDSAANLLAWTGNVKGALAVLDGVPEDLRAIPHYRDRAAMRISLGDLEGAIADLEKVRVVSSEPRFQGSASRIDSVDAVYRLTQLLNNEGKSERLARLQGEALAGAQLLVKDFPDLHGAFSVLALVLAAQGDRDAALTAVTEMERLATRTRDAWAIAKMRENKAEILAVLGDTASAIAELRTVYGTGVAYGYRLRLDPEWKALRDAPAFQQLMREAEAQADAQPRPPRSLSR